VSHEANQSRENRFVPEEIGPEKDKGTKGLTMSELTSIASDTGARPAAPPPVAGHTTTLRRIAGVMIFESTTLAAASALHLSGSVHGRSAPFNAAHAGVAEAVIGAVLLGAAFAMLRFPRRARALGIGATVFAIIGFLVGLRFTTLGGHVPDVAYHLTLLPVFVVTLVVLLRMGDGVRR
jgi:hypothetical protein